MTRRIGNLRVSVGASAVLSLTAAHGWAQTMTVSNITSGAPKLGDVVSAPSGDTTFTIGSAGQVTASGGGVRLTSTSSQVLVTLKCGGQAACTTSKAVVSVSALGSPTGRARALKSFHAYGVSAVSGTTVGDALNFVIPPIGKNAAVTFTLGMAFPIAGDNSGLNSGTAVSNFQVQIGPYPGLPTASRTSTGGSATVYRPISITKNSDLSFGAIVRPKTGSAYVAINKSSGAQTISGNAFAIPTAPSGMAQFTISGEGGQHFTVDVDDSVTMLSGSNMLVAQLLSSASGTKSFGGALGSSGTLAVTIGGGLNITSTTPSGAYVGVFNVLVQYN